jgi:hypothetical protein
MISKDGYVAWKTHEVNLLLAAGAVELLHSALLVPHFQRPNLHCVIADRYNIFTRGIPAQ